jgi:hypothetical protein
MFVAEKREIKKTWSPFDAQEDGVATSPHGAAIGDDDDDANVVKRTF